MHTNKFKTKFDKERTEALAVISKHPGITQIELSKLLAEAFGHKPIQMTNVISEMARVHQIVRVRAASDQHRFTYKLYLTVPPGVSPEDFEPRRVTHHRGSQKNTQQELPISHAPTMSEGRAIIKDVRVRNAMLDEPPMPKLSFKGKVYNVPTRTQFTMVDGEVYSIHPAHLYELYTRLAAIFNPGL